MTIELPGTWHNCERGNHWFSDDSGNHFALFDLPGTDKLLEVEVNPENYPGFNLNVLTSDESQPKRLVEHIHKHLGGWLVHKCNLGGVRIGADGRVIGDDAIEDAINEPEPELVIEQRPIAVDGNVSGDVVNEAIDKAAAMDAKFVPPYRDMLAALRKVQTALADFRDGRSISVGLLEELKYNVVDPVLDGDETALEPPRYANIYVDLPNKALIGDDHAPWDNVLSLENATKEEAVQWIRDNIGNCDDDGRIELITLGDEITEDEDNG